MIRPYKSLFLLAILAMSTVGGLHATDFQVIANPGIGVSDLSSDDLKAVFLGTKTSLGDSHVAPVLENSGAAHEAFLKECVGKSDSGLTTYYRSLVFTGKGSMPKTMSSDEEVLACVAKTKGAIGYVGAGAAPVGVKVLAVK
jgi:ABC-type phosphate transport system substrate-binding protein